MKKDEIDILFEKLKGQLDTFEPSPDHNANFLEKLQQQNKIVHLHPKKQNWIKLISIAASIALIIGIASVSLLINTNSLGDLASVSPQMKETQDFFTSAIQIQLEEINTASSVETKTLVDATMKQLAILESDYDFLKKDLILSGNDKRVISAMIKNFQKRASLLEKVLQKINTVNELKTQTNENIII